MTFLYVLIPVAVILVLIAIWVFNWAVNSGQYDDLDGPAHSILFDEEDPAHLAAQKKPPLNDKPASPQTDASDKPDKT